MQLAEEGDDPGTDVDERAHADDASMTDVAWQSQFGRPLTESFDTSSTLTGRQLGNTAVVPSTYLAGHGKNLHPDVGPDRRERRVELDHLSLPSRLERRRPNTTPKAGTRHARPACRNVVKVAVGVVNLQDDALNGDRANVVCASLAEGVGRDHDVRSCDKSRNARGTGLTRRYRRGVRGRGRRGRRQSRRRRGPRG